MAFLKWNRDVTNHVVLPCIPLSFCDLSQRKYSSEAFSLRIAMSAETWLVILLPLRLQDTLAEEIVLIPPLRESLIQVASSECHARSKSTNPPEDSNADLLNTYSTAYERIFPRKRPVANFLEESLPGKLHLSVTLPSESITLTLNLSRLQVWKSLMMVICL